MSTLVQSLAAWAYRRMPLRALAVELELELELDLALALAL
jgi:hypothetical protein